jgi:hypothetical protein
MQTMIFRWLTAALLAIGAAQALAGGMPHTGKVLETMNSGGYTYMKIEEGDASYWVAGPAAKVQVGDRVSFVEEMRMPGFTSNTLNRRFDQLLFVSGISGGTAASVPAAVPPRNGPVEPVARAEGGLTVAEVFAQKQALKGKKVKVRGRVVKVSPMIMGVNWVHLEDGTGTEGSNHIVFRSASGIAKVGAVVTAEGILDVDRDFGFGYRYEVLVEEATFHE